MHTNDEVVIVVKAQDKFTSDMTRIAEFASVTKKKLDQDLLFKLRADAAGFQIALKEAQEKLKITTNLDNKFKLTMDIHQFDYSLKQATTKLRNYLDTGDVDLTKFQARIKQVKNLFIKDRAADIRLKPIKLDPKEFQESISKVKMYARDTKKEINPLLHHKMTINVLEFQKNVDRIKSLLSDKNLRIPEKKKISLELELMKYNSGLVEAKRQLRNYENTWSETISRLQAKFNNVWTALWGAIKWWLIALGYQAANILKNSLQQLVVKAKELAINFESSFAGVKKTIESTVWQFQGLKKELKDLTTQIPLSFEEIAKIAELGGQLGIAKKDIKEFTRIVANLGTSTNLSTEAAATSLAKISNVFQLSSKDYEKLGNVIVQLGNNFATTESEIVDFSSYLMASAKTAGFTADEVFAIGSTLSSVAINAEAGGSAFSKAISVMNTAVATGDKSIKDFAKVAWLSAEEFTTQWKEKPSEAFTKFVEGLGREWAFAIPLIQELLWNNVRLQNGMLATANAGSLLRDALSMAHKEYENGSALQTEADKRYETSQSKIAMLDNELNNMSETLGKNLVPKMIWWKKVLVDVHQWVNNLFGVSDAFSDHLWRLTDQITRNEESMKKLTQAYREWKITLEEYKQGISKIGEDNARLKKQYEEEQQALEKNQQAIKSAERALEDLSEKKVILSERLAKAKEEFKKLKEGGIATERKMRAVGKEIARLTWEINSLIAEEDKYIDQKAENEQAIEHRRLANMTLKESYDHVRQSLIKLNIIQLDESWTRIEFEKTKNAALATVDAFEARLRAIGGNGFLWKYINTQLWKYATIAKNFINKTIKAPTLDTTTTNVDTNKTTWSLLGWSWSSKSKTEALKKALDQQRDLEIKAIQDSLLDEEEKMKKLTELKEKYDKKKKDLEWKTNDELLKEAQDYMEKLKKGREENYKDHHKKAEDALKDVQKYTKSLDTIKQKFQEIKDKATDTLRGIKHDMEQLDQDHIADLWARYYEVNKSIKENEYNNTGLRWITDNYTQDIIQWWKEQGQKEVNDIAIDTILDQFKLKQELLFLEQQTTKEQQEQAKIEAEKSESVKKVEKYNKQKSELLEKQQITQAFSSSEEIDGKKMLITEGEDVKYWDDQKQEYAKITDFKNQEYARDLINQQSKLETEYKTEQKHLENSRQLVIDHSKAVLSIRQQDTWLYKKELKEREDAVKQHVESVKAMMAEIARAQSIANSSTHNNQVINSNNKTTNYNITQIGSTRSSFPWVGLK